MAGYNQHYSIYCIIQQEKQASKSGATLWEENPSWGTLETNSTQQEQES